MEHVFGTINRLLFGIVLVGVIGILLNLNPTNTYEHERFMQGLPIHETPKYLTLVNKESSIPDVYPYDLVEYEGFWVDQSIYEDLKEMVLAADEKNISLQLADGYVSYGEQKEKLAEQVSAYVEAGMSEEQAVLQTNLILPPAGYSEHQTGLAVDFLYDEDAIGWLASNAYHYGFVLRYPQEKEELTKMDYNPTHYRYVGKEAAQIMAEQDYCFEEYYEKYLKK